MYLVLCDTLAACRTFLAFMREDPSTLPKEITSRAVFTSGKEHPVCQERWPVAKRKKSPRGHRQPTADLKEKRWFL